MSQPRALTVPTGALSVGDFRKVLMKTGLVLVVLGHVSFVTAALLHGTVLRHVAAPHDAVALQYCVVNILSVTCAIAVRPRWQDGRVVGGRERFERSSMSTHQGPGVTKQRAPSTNPCPTTVSNCTHPSKTLCLSLFIYKMGMEMVST